MAEALCAGCLNWRSAVDESCIPFTYSYPIDRLIRALKFHADLVAAHDLAQLLLEQLVGKPMPECVVPVPLHPRRLIERGYNQALELARPLALQLELPLDCFSCQRVRHAPPQTELDAKARRRNVRRAFAVRQRLHWRHVAILDDVVTTGSTVEELAKALKRAGARRIQVWAVARGGT